MFFDEDDQEKLDVLNEFCDAFKAGKSFDQKVLYEALIYLGFGKRKWDPNFNQAMKCANTACGHPYGRHFNFQDCGDREASCKYCSCYLFIDPV